MYICLECGCEFENPKKLTETHSLPNPPYEKIYVCPNCNSTDIESKKILHCHCCGAKILNGDREYCSEACRIKGEKLWLKESKRKNLLYTSPLYSIVRETEEYNKSHNTKYSYGQYVAFVKYKKGNDKGAKN
jgi:predicted nucleic acid-binding Zn ribbon protein